MDQNQNSDANRNFTQEQRDVLLFMYNDGEHPRITQEENIAVQWLTDLSKRQINTWFTNKRYRK